MAPRIECNKTRHGEFRAYYDGHRSAPYAIAPTAKAARQKLERDYPWRNGAPATTLMGDKLMPLMRKMNRSMRRGWLNIAGRVVFGAIAVSAIGFILLHDYIVPPVKQDNKVFQRNR